MKQFIIALLIIIPNVSCKKADDPQIVAIPTLKYCWNITTPQFQVIKTACDLTSEQIAVLYPDGFYYRSDEALKCWLNTGTNAFFKDIPASLAIKFLGIAFSEVSCGYCATWYHREKRQFVATGSITFSSITVTQLCGDTLAILYRGREIFLRQSADSIIKRQFSDNGINW